MGKPAVRYGAALSSESIGWKRQTWGTETSQYPEEEKANAISIVAASELERAQTKKLAFWGCRTLHVELPRNRLDEAVWKDPP